MSNFDNLSTGNEHGRLRVGQLIDGHYQIVDEFGRGGMGVIYRVRQLHRGNEVLLKTIAKSSLTAILVRRFEQEAKEVRALNHPGIVTVYDFGVIDDELPYLTMELIQGETLGARLSRRGALSLDEVVPIFVQICFALSYAHERRVVHRDIKPGNIMIRSDVPLESEGAVKILDFGIAKVLERDGGEIQALTRTGEVIGSPLYMSPEQCTGTVVSTSSDVYSLGCVLFEALTGAPPFNGDSALATMMQHQNAIPPGLAAVRPDAKFSKALELIVAKMLAKNPGDRYQNLGIAAHDLSQLLTTDKGGLSQEFLKSKSESKKPLPVTTWLVLAFALLVIAAVGAFVFQLPKEQKKSETDTTPGAAVKIYNPIVAKEFQQSSPDDDPVYQQIGREAISKVTIPKENGNLTIVNCKVNAEVFDAISAQKEIKNLELYDCEISNQNLSMLTKLPKLATLNLAKSTLNDEGALELSKLRQLQALNATHTSITESGVQSLIKIKNLERLDVSETELSARNFETVAHSELKGLIIKNVNINDAELKLLENSKLMIFTTRQSNITDLGLLSLAKIRPLRWLNVNRTNVTAGGVEAFCKLRPDVKVNANNCAHINDAEAQQLESKFKNFCRAPNAIQ